MLWSPCIRCVRVHARGCARQCQQRACVRPHRPGIVLQVMQQDANVDRVVPTSTSAAVAATRAEQPLRLVEHELRARQSARSCVLGEGAGAWRVFSRRTTASSCFASSNTASMFFCDSPTHLESSCTRHAAAVSLGNNTWVAAAARQTGAHSGPCLDTAQRDWTVPALAVLLRQRTCPTFTILIARPKSYATACARSSRSTGAGRSTVQRLAACSASRQGRV